MGAHCRYQDGAQNCAHSWYRFYCKFEHLQCHGALRIRGKWKIGASQGATCGVAILPFCRIKSHSEPRPWHDWLTASTSQTSRASIAQSLSNTMTNVYAVSIAVLLNSKPITLHRYAMGLFTLGIAAQ